MGRPKKFDRLNSKWKYLDKNGLPDLVYDQDTSAYHCIACNRLGCSVCFGSGYVFLDTSKHHNLIREIYEYEKGNKRRSNDYSNRRN